MTYNNYDYDYNTFKNEVLNLIYGDIPSYTYFDESNLEDDLTDGYWHAFSYEEAMKILIYFTTEYMGTNLTEEKIQREKWDAKDLLIDLLLDYF